jgi:Protein of unknown function (DUF3667)
MNKMKTAKLARFTRTVRHLDSEPCRNCDTHFNGKFCPECGQEADTGAPTAMGFIYEFLTRNVLEKGKLPRTIWHLLRYPGGLTVDFLEGRRARYIRPVRLYLIFSILYFLLLSFQTTTLVKTLSENADQAMEAAMVNEVKTAADKVSLADIDKSIKQTKSASVDKDGKVDKDDKGDKGDKNNRDAPGTKASQESNNANDLKSLINKVQLRNPKHDSLIKQEVIKRIDHFSALSQTQQIHEVTKSVINQAPKTMFFLVPVFAMLLKMVFVFRGIPYGAHLLFAAHYHALAFLVLMILLLPLPDAFTMTGVSYICLYLPVAIRTTYMCSWFGALARCFLLSVAYSVAIGLAMAGTLLVAVIAG